MKAIDIALKDLVRSLRSLFFVGMTLAAPLLLTGLMYFALGSMSGGDVSLTAIRVGVVNLDVLPASAPLETPLGNSIRSMFYDDSVKTWITARDYADEAAARAAVNAQDIGVVVIIPPTFTEAYLAGRTDSVVTILQDPTLMIGPTVVREMVTSLLNGVAGGGVAFKVVSARVEANGKTLDPASIPPLFERYADWYANFQRALFHTPEQAALVVTSPAVTGETGNRLQTTISLIMVGQLIFFSFFTGAYAMQTILQESEEGTLARLFTTPTGRTTILAGKFLAVFLTVVFQGLVLMTVAHFAFGVNWGAPASVALALFGQMSASVGLACLLVAFIKTSKQAGPIFGGALTGLGMISGLFTTNIQMPEAFNAIGNFTPQGWVLKTWKLAIAGQAPSELLGPFVVLVLLGGVMFAVGALMFRRRYV